VTKLSAAGSSLLYSTYLGGNFVDQGYGIAVDAAGSAHVTGFTESTNFPTANPVQATFAFPGADAFVTKLSAAGSPLLYSTYLGGNGTDQGHGIAVDAADQAYVTGSTTSTNFPTASPVQATNVGGSNSDVFVTKLSAAGSPLLYSTYLGGSARDQGQGIAVDATGQAYVTGQTNSTNFPTVSPVQATNGNFFDVFVAKITTNVPFAAFRANAEIELRHRLYHDEHEMRHQSHDEDVEARHRPHEDAFEMTAIFTLDPNNNGIAPLTEAVTVQVGPFSTTIPADSFTLKKGRFTYEGVINGVRLEAVLRSLTLGNDYEFKVEGKGADLTGTVNPVTVGLTIGDDSGSTTITAKH
jgi:Beta-propeller repeat